jgi:DNA-binding response OmpR family regulator
LSVFNSQFYLFQINYFQATSIEIETKMKTILVIEDNRNILENLKEYFEMEGFHVLTAPNGKLGIELAKRNKPHLILCDVLMPEMDGHEVLCHLLRSRETYNIPFIFSTSISEKVERAEALKLGADDYIGKPFELETLLNLVNFWIEHGTRRTWNPNPEEISLPLKSILG